MGLSTSAMPATSGVIATIIGLAIQINISNIFSGIALRRLHPMQLNCFLKERQPLLVNLHPNDPKTFLAQFWQHQLQGRLE